MLNTESKRKSNFELIRIVAMLFIVGHHLVVHGIKNSLEVETAYTIWREGTLINQLIASFFEAGGIGVALLVMITGYFEIENDKIKLKKVLCQVFYYALFVLCVSVMLIAFGWLNVDSENSKALLVTSLKSFLLPISCGRWFVTAYVILVIVHPLINSLVRRLNEKGMLILITFVWLYWYTFGGVLGSTIYNIQKLILFYLIGGYAKKYAYLKTKEKWICTIITAILLLLYTFTNNVANNGVVAETIYSELIKKGIYFLDTDVIIPLAAFLIFTILASTNIKSNAVLNTIASTTFGIYLLHDSVIGRLLIWNEFLDINMIYLRSDFPAIAFGYIFVVFIGCSIIDLLRIYLFEHRMLFVAEKSKKIFISKFCKTS